MEITSQSALWLLPAALPICMFAAFTDLATMKITNWAVVILAVYFGIFGILAIPDGAEYLVRLCQGIVAFCVGLFLFSVRAMGGGDAKFIAAGAPYLHLGDTRFLLALFTAALIGAVITHAAIKRSRLRELAPHWVSWDCGNRFPLGFPLGMTLASYLLLGTYFGH